MQELMSPEIKEQFQEELRNVYRSAMEQAQRDFAITKEFLTIKQSSEYLNCSSQTIDKWIKQYSLPVIKIDSKKYLSKTDIFEFMNKHKI